MMDFLKRIIKELCLEMLGLVYSIAFCILVITFIVWENSIARVLIGLVCVALLTFLFLRIGDKLEKKS